MTVSADFRTRARSELTSAQTAHDERGRGLQLVHAIADGWGATPTRDGKVVWATVG
jgi:hypothetical protein